jgi:hypothetical protein
LHEAPLFSLQKLHKIFTSITRRRIHASLKWICSQQLVVLVSIIVTFFTPAVSKEKLEACRGVLKRTIMKIFYALKQRKNKPNFMLKKLNKE